MDRYLFRGKRIDNGGWVEGSLISCGITGKRYIFPNGNDANESDKTGHDGCLMILTFEVIPETVGQCTGLTDKNGKLIYEYDILRHAEGTFVVAWDFDHARFEMFKDLDENGYVYHIGIACSCEIIGNIYETPELLTIDNPKEA